MKRILRWVVIPLVLLLLGFIGGQQIAALAPAKQARLVQVSDENLERNIGGAGSLAAPSMITGNIIEVHEGEVIQDAVAKAQNGDTIMVFPGVYNETVYIDKDDISLIGVVIEGSWPTFDGEKKLNDAILYSGNGTVIENFTIINYKGNGIMGQAGNNFIIRNNLIRDAGVYGIFPQFGTNGVIEHNVLSGIEDAAIYVGMCDNIDVRHNEVYGNVAGIEIENSRHALVENNYVYDNAGGILVFALPGLPIKTTYDVVVRNNFVVNNNHENFATEGSIVSTVPKGTGMLILAADDVVIENNIISGNDNAGIIITSLDVLMDPSKDPETDPRPERIVIMDNIMEGNGENMIGELKALLAPMGIFKGPDIIDTGAGRGKCILDVNRYRTLLLDHPYDVCDRMKHATTGMFTMTLPELAPNQNVLDVDVAEIERSVGKRTYFGICTGCHLYDERLIGPPISEIQKKFGNSDGAAIGVAAYINSPVKIRKDYPDMPPQNYLTEETRIAVAKYMLNASR